MAVDAGYGSTCLDADSSAGRTTITYGEEGLGYSGGGPLTLTDVDLRGADGIRWSERQQVPGAVLPARADGSAWNPGPLDR